MNWDKSSGFLITQKRLLPVDVRGDVKLSDLLQIDEQKSAFLHNLDKFLLGLPFNHVLLWGARGTGKSSLVRAAFLDRVQQKTLKIVQINQEDISDLALILWRLGQVKLPFLVFIDDLSFTTENREYRTLKSVLDGAICQIPSNVLLVITSNRRHLLNENFINDHSIHPEEDVEEQISLSERFGLRLAFHSLTQDQFLQIVAHWLNLYPLPENVIHKALQFSLLHGSRSARTAEQFCRSFEHS